MFNNMFTGLWWLFRYVLLSADIGRRADFTAYLRLHWHYSQEGMLTCSTFFI